MSAIDYQVVSWRDHENVIKTIRTEVFIQEQRIPINEEWDEYDALLSTQHIVAYKNAACVGYLRLLANGQISRVCVTHPQRRQGIATELLRKAIIYAREHGQIRHWVHAQTSALNLYKQLGFVAIGDSFDECGIPHIKMELTITTPNEAKKIYSDSVIRFDSNQVLVSYIDQMALLAKREMRILTHQLNPLFYGEESTAELISELARHSRFSDLRILIYDTKPLHGKRHPLISLAQRLPSKLQIKKCTLTPKSKDEAFITFDQQMLIYFNAESTCYGFANFNAKAEAKNYEEEFNYLWQSHSQDDENFKILNI